MKQEQIINVARRLFSKYGYKRVSMDEIAKEANVTKKTLYSYFKSKEELLKYFINEELQNMKKIVQETEDENKNFFENINEVVCKLLKYTHNRQFLRIIIEESELFKNPTIIESLKIINQEIQDYIQRKLIYAVDKGYINVENIEITTFIIYKMYVSLMFEWGNEQEKIDDNIIAENVIKLLKNGLERK